MLRPLLLHNTSVCRMKRSSIQLRTNNLSFGNERLHWAVEPSPLERSYITLFCKLNPKHDRVLSYHLFPRIDFKSHRSFNGDPWLNTGMRLKGLEEFYSAVKKLILVRVVDE